MAIREDKIGQTLFLSVGDMIPKDHICNLVVAIMDGIDVSGAEEKFIGTAGSPAYSRRMLLRLLVQAAIDGVWSSRDIGKLARENIIYMYLTGNEKPDFRTICLFRKENKELVERTFKKVVSVAHGLGILDLGHLSTDGTKIKANASNNRVLRKKDIDWINEIIEKGIEMDEEEDELYGDMRGDELPPELDTKEKIQKKLRELEESEGKKLKGAGKKLIERHIMGDEKEKKNIEKTIEKAIEGIEESGQESVSLTDPEARFMENKKKRKELSYNPQITVDHGSGMIIANDVTQDCNDHHQLKPQVEKTEKNLGELLEGVKTSFDNGYFNGPNLRYLEGKKLDGYIPDSKQAQEMKSKKLKDNPYSKDKFEYDEEKDCFICPQSEVLTKKGEYEYKGKPQYSYYGANCGECPAMSECAGKRKMRIITSGGYEAEQRRMAIKMRSEKGREEYKKRKEAAEWPFGNIKQNLGLREFLTRGIGNVRTEFNLACIAHDLIVMWNKLEGNVAVVREIRGSISKIEGLSIKLKAFLKSNLIINTNRLLLRLDC